MSTPVVPAVQSGGKYLSLSLICLLGAFLFLGESAVADTVVKLGAVTQISGPQDLDLDGEFLYAINFSTDDPPRTVHGVTFLPDNKKIPGATLVGPQQVTPWQSKPEFGSTVDANQLEEIFADIRWANTGSSERLRATLVVTNAEEYKLQILISGNSPEDRRWDIRVNGKDAVDEITSLGASPGQTYSVNRATLYTYQFTSSSNKLVVEMGTLFGINDGGDRNPIWQALTLKRVFIPPAPDDITLTPDHFFGTQAASIGHLRAVDRKSQTTHLFSLVAGSGDTDNSKFTLVGSDFFSRPFDFSAQPAGSVYSIRVRATDSGDAKRFLEKTFQLTLAAAHAPTGLTLDALSISSFARPGAIVGHIRALDADDFDRHAFELLAGNGDSDNALFGVVGNDLRLAQALPAGRTQLNLRLQATDLAGLSLSTALVLSVTTPIIRINELLASSLGGTPDEAGQSQEYIELRNELPQWVDLAGSYLTDQPSNPTRWKFPASAIPPYGFLVILADGAGVGPPGSALLHASFSLDSMGSRVQLVWPDGQTVASRLEAPVFFPGVSYGVGTDGRLGYFAATTPGTTNSMQSEFGENSVSFSIAHGFYTKSFSLSLTSAVPGSTLWYTTDGSLPAINRGTVYTAPILIKPNTTGVNRGTRIIRALAASPAAAYAPVQTQTYLFIDGESGPLVDGVVGQSQLVASIVKSPIYGPLMHDALLALPAVSLVLELGPDGRERSASLELFDPAGQEEGFQIDCGIKATGTTSLGSPKLSMAAKFRSDYGRSKLQYPLFARGSMVPAEAATEFKSLRLRSHSHDTFYWLGTSENPPVPYGNPPVNRSGDAQLTRNPWIDEMQLLMGQPGKHGRQVHLFLNGAYHGIYHIHEHADDDYMASYYPGRSSDFHFSAAALSGSDHAAGDTWREPWNAMKASLRTYSEAVRWVDVTNLCDYMVLSFYAGNDWDWSAQHNWSAAGPKLPDRGGWKFFEQDSDITLQDIIADCTDQDVPDGIFTALMVHPDFRSLFRDRVYHHCFNGGALTPRVAGGLYEARMNEMTNAIVAETARWQPSSSVSPLPWDRNQEWTTEWKYLRETFFPLRSTRLVEQLRKHTSWWPLDPPELGQLSGVVSAGFELRASTLSGVMYYTTDGSDPRLPGGKINPTARRLEAGVSTNRVIQAGSVWRFLDTGVDPGVLWKDLGFDDAVWRSGAAEIGYGDGGESTVAGFVDTDPLVTGIQRNITTYFRKSFDAPGVTNFQSLKLRMVRDDGVVTYLNGVEIYRNNMPAGPVTAQTRALTDVSGTDETAFQEATFNLRSLDLRPSGNLLAVEIHQRAPTSTDMSFNCELIGYGFAPNSSIRIDQPTLIRARAYSGTNWSALVEASLGTDAVPAASAATLLVSEIQYNPMDQSANEFLEFLNTSATAVDLSEIVITQAVGFRFTRPTILNSQERIVVAKDLLLFEARYRTNTSPFYRSGIRVVGPWTGSLANDGETISVLSREGALLLTCTYGASGAWSTLPDGHGSSLEVVDPESAPKTPTERSAWLSDPVNWQPSVEFHGSPGWSGDVWNRPVVINEILASTTPPQTDAIEFKNLTDQAIDLGGYWVSDSFANYKKFVFPVGTRIEAQGWRVLKESDFNNPGSPSNPVPFAFSATGEQVFLVQGNASGNLLRFVDGFTFGAVDRDVPLGRWPDGTGPLVWLQSPTLGTANSLPVPGYAAWVAATFAPGTAVEITTPDADPDGDGISNFGEYAFVTPPLRTGSAPLRIAPNPTGEGLTFVYRKRSQAADLTYRLDVSSDLRTWDTTGSRIQVLGEVPQPDGSTWVTARLQPNVGDPGSRASFVRITVLP